MSNPSRREALLAGAAGLGSLAWAEHLDAEERRMPSFSFLVVSDTHLGRGDEPAAARQWERTARELDAAEGDFVLHLGDLVDAEREAQYAVYREARGRIRKPVHEIPGNHDRLEHFERHIRRPVDTAFDHQGVRFLLFNDSRTDSHDGFITPGQLEWLEGQCTEAARRELFLILCTHVPVHTNRHPDRGWHVRPRDGQDALYALLGRHRQRVLALFHGHFHNGVRGWNDNGPLHEICFPSSLYNQDRNLAAQRAPGYYMADLRPGFVKVTLARAGMTLRYKAVGVEETSERRCELPQLGG